jgi:phenylpropionate dioxygenase-like ring-hydroxylating dioxygenase large terminal subunit
MSYLLNCWHMAGWSDELRDGLIARTICGVSIVLFRIDDGVAALADKCPHRFAPLSRGKRKADAIECGYHGLVFGADGQCIHNPHGPVTHAMRVKRFPAVEKYRGIWVWMGAPEQLDLALLPNFSCLDRESREVTNKGGYLHGQANYLLYIDNIMDLSHIDYLHAGFFAERLATGVDLEIEEDDRSLKLRWCKQQQRPGPRETELGLFDKDTLFDRYTEVAWYPPGAMVVTASVGSAGVLPKPTHNVIHVMTPESDKTTHYFWLFTRGDMRVNDVEFHRRLNEERRRVFETEDSPMIAAVQQRMATSDLFSLKPMLLRTDQAAVRVRRRLASMISMEASITGDHNV